MSSPKNQQPAQESLELNRVINHYQAEVDAGRITADPSQLIVAKALDELLVKLVARWSKMSLLKRWFTRTEPPPAGLYIWGGVGAGKTFLMDIFMHDLPFEGKLRIHFYRFMQQVHKGLKQHAGTANPLAAVAKQWAEQVKVICFDEFLVNDIADAMLLGELLQHLFHHQVCLVTTSNVPPDMLYANGLQRRRFLPAIEMLKTHTQAMQLNTTVDYRRQILQKTGVYHCPLGPKTDKKLWQSLCDLSIDEPQEACAIVINNRSILSRFATEGAVWFDFLQLCDGPRSQFDYIEIANSYTVVLVSDIPQLSADQDDQMRRFISLVDELYDSKVKLVLSAAVPLEQLYTGIRLGFEFERTRSRLIEMQSAKFLSCASHHIDRKPMIELSD